MRQEQDKWYVIGRDKGIAFDTTVAIHLAKCSVRIAGSSDQKGAALNDLGIALKTLGQRETGTERLEQAVEAYTDALKECTRDLSLIHI